jgi:hypothetical protein
MITRGRGQTFLADGCVERLNLVTCDLIELPVPESLSKTQPVQLLILLGGALPGPDIREIVFFHERGESRHGPLVLLVLTRVPARGDFRLQLQGLLLCVGQADVVCATYLDVFRATRVFVPEHERAFPGTDVAHLHEQARQFL